MLEPRVIKCAIVSNSRTQKDYMFWSCTCTRKFPLMWLSLSHFCILLLVLLILYLNLYLVLGIWKNRLYLSYCGAYQMFQEWILYFTPCWSKIYNCSSWSSSYCFSTYSPPLLTLRCILLLLQTWTLLLLIERANNLVLNILVSILFHVIVLPHCLISLLCLCLLFLS